MNRIIITSALAFCICLSAAAQKTKLPPPSLAAGGDWYFVTGFGANLKFDVPVADGYAITVSASYDGISKASDYKNLFNIFSGIRFGDATDLYAYAAVGYSHFGLRQYNYFNLNSGAASVHVGGGYVFDSNIDVGTDVGILTSNSVGSTLTFKLRVAYVFRLSRM